MSLSVNQLIGFGARRPSPSYVPNGANSHSTMTSDSAPSGHVASGTDKIAGSNWYTAFDYSSASTVSIHGDSGFSGNLTRIIQTPSPIYVVQYKLSAQSGFVSRAPTAWTIARSDNGTSWTTVDTRSGQSLSGGSFTTYTISGPHQSATYWRFAATANGGDTYCTCGGLSFLS